MLSFGLIIKEETAEKINIGNPFPLDVLPKKVREIIDEANVTLGFPKDYLAMSMLTAMSAAICDFLKCSLRPNFWNGTVPALVSL